MVQLCLANCKEGRSAGLIGDLVRIDAKMYEEPAKLYPEIAVADSEEQPTGSPPQPELQPWERLDAARAQQAGAEHGQTNDRTESEEGERRGPGRPGYTRRDQSRTYTRDSLAIEIVVDSMVIVPTRPAKEQIANHLLSMISLGVFGPGDRLPPERWLAQQSVYKLTRAIVQDAYDILESMGVIERIPNVGAYVRSAEASRMYFVRQHFLDAIGAAIRTQLTRTQIERAFHEAVEMMFASRDPIRANTRRTIRAEMQLEDERVVKEKQSGQGEGEERK